MSAISEMGVNIVESDDGRRKKKDEPEEIDARRRRPASGGGHKKEAVDRTDDPVRMYLREMGSVELLSREGEIAIAKRIEAGRDTMIWGLCESPITFNAIIEWSNALNEGTMQLREIRSRCHAFEELAPEAMADDAGKKSTAKSAKVAGPSCRKRRMSRRASGRSERGRRGQYRTRVRPQVEDDRKTTPSACPDERSSSPKRREVRQYYTFQEVREASGCVEFMSLATIS
jgi:RNA polymerase primary sigma factor